MITTPGPKFMKNDGRSGAKSGDHTHRASAPLRDVLVCSHVTTNEQLALDIPRTVVDCVILLTRCPFAFGLA